MASSKTFALPSDLTLDQLGDHLVAWFQTTKNMISEGGRAQGGYFVQAKDQEDGWKKLSGMTRAIQVQMLKADSNVIVNCDFGKWSDKVGAGAVGMLVFAPLAATAAFGAVKQSKLPDEIFAEIEKYIMFGGKSAVVSIGSRIGENELECPSCGAKNPKGQNFCKECGAKLGRTCPHCGAAISNETKFCPSCGNSTQTATACIQCGAPLADGQAFCPSCGAKQAKICPQCGATVKAGSMFCTSCGAAASGKKFCSNCKAELQANEPFCSQCGAKVE